LPASKRATHGISSDPVDRLIALPDGRDLAVAQYGAAAGEPVLVFHGLPGSRRQRHPDDGIARSLGARLLHFDRPGFGRSDPAPRRTVASLAADVSAACDALDLRRIRLAGVSGGAPYALACAALLPERVLKTAIVSGIGPPGTMPGSQLRLKNRLGLLIAPRAAWLLRPFAWGMGSLGLSDPEGYLDAVAEYLNPADRRLLERQDVRAMFAEDLAEAFAQSGAAFTRDLALIARDWGIDLGAVRAPLRLWHGTEDRAIPASAAQALAARVRGAELTLLPGEGHFLVFERWPEILAWLLR
jgi:pimeloyl-ACP methyl ester carboxylesterase